MLLIDGDNVKPGVLLIQQGYVRRTLHDLDRVRRIHGAHQTEGQAASGVIAVSGVVALPFLQARIVERQFGRSDLALILVGLGHVRDVGSRPEPAQIRLAIRGSGRGTSLYRRRRLRVEIPSILRRLGEQGSAGERSEAECCSEKRNAHEDLLVERPFPHGRGSVRLPDYCAGRLGAPSSAEPANTLLPLGSFTDRALQALVPSLERKPSTVAVSPIFSESLLQPLRVRVLGGPPSHCQ